MDALCGCPLCRNHTRAYLRHLMRANEMLGMRLAVMHNLWFYNTLMEEIRLALERDGLRASTASMCQYWVREYKSAE